MPDEHSSFWTTLPGILTGVAALITALVGAAALILGLRDDTVTPTEPSTTQSTSESTGGGNGQGSTVEMRVGDGLDVDTGTVGDVSGSEVFWSSAGGWDLNGRRAALVEGEPDQAACRAALEQRTDTFQPVGQFDDQVVCLETTEGVLAAVAPSTPDASGRMTVSVTVWA